MNYSKCAFTGHRNLINFNRENLVSEIKKLIAQGVNEFYCGMALGFDLTAAEIIIELKKECAVKLIACVPCPDQDKFFSDSDKEKYRYALENSDEIKILAPYYFNGCMQKRNRFLVDSADIIICYLKKNFGGTYYTVNYALSQGKDIIYID